MSIRVEVIAFIGLVLVLFLSYWFAEQPVAVGLIPPPYDKLVHAAMGAGAALLLWVILKGKAGWLNIGIVASLSGLEEWHQSFLPGRVPDLYDSVAATMAAVIFVTFLDLYQRKRKISA